MGIEGGNTYERIKDGLKKGNCPSNTSEIGEKIAKYLCRLNGSDDKNKTLDSIDEAIKELKGRKIRTEKSKPNKVKPKRVKRNTPNAIPILPTLEKDEK